MKLSLTDDQRAILDAVDALVRPFTEAPPHANDFVLFSHELDCALAEGGFLDVAADAELGLGAAALLVERLARLPYAVEAAASACVRPLLGDLPRPLCLADAARPYAPVRFLQPGASVVHVRDGAVVSFTAGEADIASAPGSLFAYPVAMLKHAPADRVHDLAPATLLTRWRVALAAEMAGLLRDAVDRTVQYVSERKQFGRALGAFQGVRHRLAEAHTRTEGARWLALKAAGSGDSGDAALAAHFAQSAAMQIVYDLHQFLGAMGVTLEHPLHLWTYRLKALSGELGGALANAKDAAGFIWAA
jgi:alkylation response protein AidB-like acyl-CoA dehydrogenase